MVKTLVFVCIIILSVGLQAVGIIKGRMESNRAPRIGCFGLFPFRFRFVLFCLVLSCFVLFCLVLSCFVLLYVRSYQKCRSLILENLSE